MNLLPVLKSFFCFSVLTPVGGGIPHGVLQKMGPGGNVRQLTEHRPLWTGSHETVQSLPDTIQKCNKAQADTEAGEGAGAAGSGLAEPDPFETKNKGGKRGSVSWAPELVENLPSESGSVSEPLTDMITVAHVEQVTAEVNDQAAETFSEPEGWQARKFSVDASANQEGGRPRRDSAG